MVNQLVSSVQRGGHARGTRDNAHQALHSIFLVPGKMADERIFTRLVEGHGGCSARVGRDTHFVGLSLMLGFRARSMYFMESRRANDPLVRDWVAILQREVDGHARCHRDSLRCEVREMERYRGL